MRTPERLKQMNEPMKVSSIRLSQEMLDRLAEASRLQGGAPAGRTKNVIIREAIDHYLKKEEGRERNGGGAAG